MNPNAASDQCSEDGAEGADGAANGCGQVHAAQPLRITANFQVLGRLPGIHREDKQERGAAPEKNDHAPSNDRAPFGL